MAVAGSIPGSGGGSNFLSQKVKIPSAQLLFFVPTKDMWEKTVVEFACSGPVERPENLRLCCG